MPLPFDKTLWFRALVGMLLLGGVLFFVKKLRRLRRKDSRGNEGSVQIPTSPAVPTEAAEPTHQHQASPPDSADQRWLQQLDEVVRLRLADFDLQMANLADDMHLSRSQFFRKIKAVTGLTPNQYLQEARLREAKRLLESGACDSVKAVSYSVGFRQAGYFARIFKEKYGMGAAGYFGES